MSASLRQWCVAALAAAVVAAVVAPMVVSTAVAEPSASFEKRVVYEQTGDVANVTVEADAPATVYIKSRNDAFVLRVRVGKGTTKLRLNTYEVGNDSTVGSEEVWAADGSIKGRTLLSDPIDAPLDPAQYDMNVSVNGVEKDRSALWLQRPTVGDVTARIAPRTTNVSNLMTGGDASDATVPPVNGSVARDDWLLVHVNATGVKGVLGVRGTPAKSQLHGDVMRVAFEQTNSPMNAPANEFYGDSVRRVFTHPNSEGFYLAVDTGDPNHGIEPGDRYRISFVIPDDSPFAGAKENASTTVRVVERRVTIQENRPGSTVVVEDETTIRGTTTLTPGSTINVTARGNGVPPLFEHHVVEVDGDRRFAATFDFSGYERGREFEFWLRDQGRTVPGVVEGVVTTTEETTEPEPTEPETTPPTTTPPSTTTVPPTTTTTSPPTTTVPPNTTTAPPNTTTRTPTTTADGLTQAPMDATGRELTQQAVRGPTTEGGDGPVPGFGPVAAVAALAAGLVLAVRRL